MAQRWCSGYIRREETSVVYVRHVFCNEDGAVLRILLQQDMLRYLGIYAAHKAKS